MARTKVASETVESKNKALVLEAFDTLFNKRDYAAAERFWSPDYIQHSAHIEPGRDGLFNLIKSIPPTLKYEPGAIVAEGDLVILHGRFSNFGLPVNWIASDIVRIKDGVLAEHWDVHSGRSDGRTVEKQAAHVRNDIPDLRLKSSTFRRIGLAMIIARNEDGPRAELERSLPSEVAAISPFVDGIVLLIRQHGCVPEGETDVEVALREALANAIVHGNNENPRKQVHVHCCFKRDEVSIAVKDEGRGFDINKVADPTAPENTGSVHGRGIYLMKAFMDEVRFEQGGVVVHMRKSARQAAVRDAPRNSLK
ncbi:MAG: ATP-binding protein [Candidatus Acidiferrales bacterium]